MLLFALFWCFIVLPLFLLVCHFLGKALGKSVAKASNRDTKGLGCFISIALVILFGGGFIYGISVPSSPETVYNQCFNTYPTQEVKILEARSEGMGDSGSAEIIFEASPTWLQNYLKHHPKPDEVQGNDYTWNCDREKCGDIPFSSEHRTLNWNPATKQIHYTVRGVD